MCLIYLIKKTALMDCPIIINNILYFYIYFLLLYILLLILSTLIYIYTYLGYVLFTDCIQILV
nr:MAG TPA: hypothetical protein [Bacteriophage sp.]